MYRFRHLMAAAVVVSLYIVAISEAELVGWWKLDETAGAVVTDSSGKGNHGTGIGAFSWVPGRIGGAWQGNGSDAYIRVPHSDSLNLSNAVTISMWVYSTAAPTRQLICKGTGGTAWWSSYSLRMGNTVPATGTRRLNFRGNNTGSHPNLLWSNTDIPLNEWIHIAVTFDVAAPGNNQKIYFNGQLDAENSSSTPLSTNTADLLIGADAYGTTRWWWAGMLDDVRIYDEAIPANLIPVIMLGGGLNPGIATNPDPADKATDITRDVVLSWTSGAFPCTHDVYFGGVLEDVSRATRDDPRGVLVSRDQVDTRYDPVGLLEYGKTYYWRVDEVNSSADRYIHKGSVWSFTVEPYAYVIRPIGVRASSYIAGSDPQKTIDGSGLDAYDQHSTSAGAMWLSDASKGLPAWIEFEFNKVYKLYQLWVWNSNMVVEGVIGQGARDVDIEVSRDGNDWVVFREGVEFSRGSGQDTYRYNTVVDLAGVVCRYIRLRIRSNWGGIVSQTGLSEVRFFYVPTYAYEPSPRDGAVGVGLDEQISWRSGRDSSLHRVYLGIDREAVVGGRVGYIETKDRRVLLSQFNPEYGRTYYWRVDEVNEGLDGGIWEGDVWSFSTIGYKVVDDFELYDDICNRIFFRWLDGLGHSGSKDCGVEAASGNGTGSVVGNLNPPFAERVIVNSGRQSMPFGYDNSLVPYYSEARRIFKDVQSWTDGGVDTLRVYIRGIAPGFMEYLPGSMLLNGMGSDIYGTVDQGRFVYKRLRGDGSIVARVEGLGNTHAWAKVGVMIRSGLEANAAWAYVLYAGENGVRFQARLASGASATSDTPIATVEQVSMRVPVWVKLERRGNEFYGYYSKDGINWVRMVWSPQVIVMPVEVYIGIAITSHVSNVVCGGKVTGVSTSGDVIGEWVAVDLGVSQSVEPGNGLADVYVEVRDDKGNSRMVVRGDPSIVATGAWEVWDIGLDRFSGVSLGRVKEMVIGIGNKTNPSPGGKGTVYIDDIRLIRAGN